MSSSLSGKTILVTGAASGIGRATALRLATLGVNLILTDVEDIDYDLAYPLADETLSASEISPVITASLDVSDEDQCELVIKESVQYYGQLDHVFNCAGINPTAYPLLESPAGYFDKLINVNLKGTYNVMRAALPHLKEHNGCSFVNVSSILGQRPSKDMAIYCATKYAIVGFSKSMALELGPKGIRVNVVAPGYIDTPTNSSVIDGVDAVKQGETLISMGRFGTADEVAGVVVFLMSDEAKYMNGSVVEVNGGMTV